MRSKKQLRMLTIIDKKILGTIMKDINNKNRSNTRSTFRIRNKIKNRLVI